MAGSNWFSDLLGPISDTIEGIPILGDVVKYADKLALNTDPSQLGTAAIGKMIGGDTEEYYTSEKARKGASHNIGTAMLAYLLGGSSAAGAEPSGVAAGAEGSGLAGIDLAAGSGELGAGAGYAGAGEYGSLTAAELATYAAEGAAMSEAGITGGAGAGIFSAGGAPYASSAGTLSKSTLSKLMSNKLLMQYLSNAGKDLSKYGGDTDKGMQFTNTNAVTTQSIQAKNYADLMTQLLGPDEERGFENKEVTLNDSILYKNFLGKRGKLIKGEPLPTSSKLKGDLFSNSNKGMGSTDNQLTLEMSRQAF